MSRDHRLADSLDSFQDTTSSVSQARKKQKLKFVSFYMDITFLWYVVDIYLDVKDVTSTIDGNQTETLR